MAKLSRAAIPELNFMKLKLYCETMRLSKDEELKRRCDAIVFDPKLFKALDDCIARLNALHFLLNDVSTGLSVN